MVDAAATITCGARAVTSLAPALTTIEDCPQELADGRAAVERGYFTPVEDERLRLWFARYLTARAGLLEVIADFLVDDCKRTDEHARHRAFLVAYTAACLLVKAGRFLVDRFATHSIVQRKLNEPEPRFRIPDRQYTVIYRSLTDPVNAWRLREATGFADKHREALESLAADEELAPVLDHLHDVEEALRVGVGLYVKSRLRYRLHSVRRRRVSAAQQIFFVIAEAFGRAAAEVCNPWHEKRVTGAVLERIGGLLAPGDVIVTRHDDAFSNLFLPGFWPHASLFVGPRVLEARKDGVLFRELADTLSVDAVAVIRPCLEATQVARCLTAAATHEGKLYNFDFDFFRADRLVCTEVVYRAYDGDVQFVLTNRGGRPTLSAEDLLDMAVDGRFFQPVAVYGATGCRDSVVTGESCLETLAATYR